MYMLLNERREGRKKEASKVKQINKAKQQCHFADQKYAHPYIHVHVRVYIQ